MPCPAAHLQPTKTPTGGHPAPALHIYTYAGDWDPAPPVPPLASGLRGAWAQLCVACVYSRAGLAGCWPGWGKSGREKPPPNPEV